MAGIQIKKSNLNRHYLCVAKYPNHANLDYGQINIPKTNQNNLTWWIRFVLLERFYFLQKQKVAKLLQGFALRADFILWGFARFVFFLDSPKVSDSLLIHNSPKWILRAVALSMTAWADLSLRGDSTNRRNNLFCLDCHESLCDSRNDAVWCIDSSFQSNFYKSTK